MSSVARNQVFSAVHTVGSLLPSDMLVRVSEGKDVSGSQPGDYRVVGSRSVRDEAERHWDYLRSVWSDLREKLPPAPQSEAPADARGLAVHQWLSPLFAELGFGALTSTGPEGIASDDGTKNFPISHRWNHVPIHFTSWNSELDKRVDGAVPPQSLVQEMLNRTSAHLWGVVTNGRQMRLLRDSNAFATAAYVEFDLEAIFDGELFSEFVLLYRLLHVSRFEVADGAGPATCRLERWRLDAMSSGTRALDQLRDGVEEAIKALGTGFLRHPANSSLRANVDPRSLHRALLRLVYRLLFVFVVEDRELLHPKLDSEVSPEHRAVAELARERYAAYFSTAKLRTHARRRRGTAHDDLYRVLSLVLDALGDEDGRPELALPGLGGIFDHTDADAPLDGLALSNAHLLTAVRHLCQVKDPASKRVRSVDYRHLGAEELGSIYESLLERVPQHSAVDREFSLVALAGNERKTTGSYYTPSSLIECLLDSTLDPVIDDAVKRGEQRATAENNLDSTDAIVGELLSLTVCDPACGSGHFLLAAARRIAKRVAAVRDRNPEPTIETVREALHDVIARCIYGVDLNPMAVELAKVSLWLEAMEPGKPLSFLNAHIKVGNALIGATPSLLRNGISDAAFIPTEGDDKKVAKSLERRNRDERQGQLGLFDSEEPLFTVTNTPLAEETERIMNAPADELTQVRDQAEEYAELEKSADYLAATRLADAWCAAFVWLKTPDSPRAISHDVFGALEDGDDTDALTETVDEIKRLRQQYRFFHWHLEFPHVFTVRPSGAAQASGWSGGFDCVIGNPPWDSVQLKEQEFFAQRSPEIAAVGKSDVRKRMINRLRDDPDTQPLFRAYSDAKRQVYAESHFLRRSGRLPLTARGNLNTYAVFAETARIATAPRGRTGVIVPSGIATDARTQHFFKALVSDRALTALYDFENRDGLFPAVDSRMKFCALSLAGREVYEAAASFAFFLRDPAELDEPDKAFALTPEEITLLNPNTGTCPVFRSRRDAEITLGIYRRVPVLVKEPDEHGLSGSNPWGVSFMTMFHMSHDARFFHTREDLERDGWDLHGNVFTKGRERMLPLYEAKMLHHYDHRWATYDANGNIDALEGKRKPDAFPFPRYWAPENDVPTERIDKNGRPISEPGIATRLAAKKWGRNWLIGWRDICRSTDTRTVIGTHIPLSGVGDKYLLMFPESEGQLLQANILSFAFDFIARQKLGGTSLKFFTMKQLPVLDPAVSRLHRSFINHRTIELTYTAHDMTSFAQDLGDTGAPFRWDEERRAGLRAELDALFFHLYGVSRDDADYILDTFHIVKRKDEAKYGTYRTKDLILAEYDKMTEAGLALESPLREGENYTSSLTPPPGHGPRHSEP